MHSRSSALAMAAMLAAGPGPAMSDQVKKRDLVGAWRYETSYIEFPDGHRESQFGEHPQGLFIILPNGWYSHVIMRDDLPRYSSGVMQKATNEEAQAVAAGELAHFGTWTLDEREGTFTAHVCGQTSPTSMGLTSGAQSLS
jgi:Lipocalin-like domain